MRRSPFGSGMGSPTSRAVSIHPTPPQRGGAAIQIRDSKFQKPVVRTSPRMENLRAPRRFLLVSLAFPRPPWSEETQHSGGGAAIQIQDSKFQKPVVRTSPRMENLR